MLTACASPLPKKSGATPSPVNHKKKAVQQDLTTLPEVAPDVEQDSHPTGPEGIKGPGVPDFWVRPGYKVTLVAHDLGNARFMVMDSNGTLYLSRPEQGDIVMLERAGSGYKITGTFISGLSKPHGMQVKDGWLWFTSDGKVSKAKLSDGTRSATIVTDVLTGLPQGGHWWRSILVTDQYFYTSIGDAGNDTDLRATDREKIWRYNLDGSGKHMFVSGIRNTEKLLIRPGTNDIFGCDQGSDWFGAPLGDKQGDQPITDYNPPDEFNHYVDGGFYGHPFIVGNKIPRYEFMNRPDIRQLAAQSIAPAWDFGPHWAADGWIFLNHSKLPAQFDRNAVIALHGSWNRSKKAGYRIEMVMFDPVLNFPIGGEMLVGTLSANQATLARPVDVVQEQDGSLLFSDDQGSSIYRITYVGSSSDSNSDQSK